MMPSTNKQHYHWQPLPTVTFTTILNCCNYHIRSMNNWNSWVQTILIFFLLSHQQNVMIHQATSFMVRQNLGSQMIALFVCVVMAHLSAWLQYAVTQTVKNLCILRASAVPCAPWLTRALQGIMRQVTKQVYSSIFKVITFDLLLMYRVFHKQIYVKGTYHLQEKLFWVTIVQW